MATCGECAFLGKRWGVWNQHFTVASAEERVGGVLNIHEDIAPGNQMGTIRSATIACYRLAWDLDSESLPDQPGKNGTLPVIQKQRNCDAYFRWIPFWTAPEQLQAQRDEMLEQARLANSLKMAEIEARSQEALRGTLEAQTRMTEMLKQVSENHLAFVQLMATKDDSLQRQFMRMTRATFIVACISLLQVLQLAYPNGIGPLVAIAPGQPRVIASATPTATPTPTVAPTAATP